jgi:hypothetical protein
VKSRWWLNDAAACIELIDEHWNKAESAEQLLALLPLASPVAAFDVEQRTDIINSVAEPQPLRLGLG